MLSGRVLAAATLVAVGTVVLIAGPEPLLAGSRWLLAESGVLLCVAAAVVLLRLAPPHARRVALVLAAGGALVLLLQETVTPTAVAGGAVIAVGVALPEFLGGSVYRSGVDPVHTYRRFIAGRSIKAPPDSRSPRQIRLHAYGSRSTELDLGMAHPGASDFLEIHLTCWFARVDVTVPAAWVVVGGRAAATRQVHCTGELDFRSVITDLADPEQESLLLQRIAERSTGLGGERVIGVVIHLAGAFSRVQLLRA